MTASMSGKMTSRERLLSAIRREPVDYVPCCASFNPLSETLRKGHPWNFPWSESASRDEQVIYQVEQLDLDAVVHEEFALTRSPADVSEDIRMNGDVLHKRVRTPAGDLCAAVRYNELWPHGRDIPWYSDHNVGHYVEPWIKTARDVECLNVVQTPLSLDQAIAANREHVERSLALARKYALPTAARVGTGLTGAQHLFGVEGLCVACIEQPDMVHAYLEHEHQRNLLGIEVAAAFGLDIVRRNGFYETADFYGPEMLTAFLKRRLDAEADAARRSGLLTAYTLHTGVMPILDYLAALKFGSFFGIDIAFRNLDLRALRDALAPTKAFWTGPSSTYHLWKGPEATRQAVREVFEVFGKTGLILTPCVSAHSIMPWESTLAMIDEWKKLR